MNCISDNQNFIHSFALQRKQLHEFAELTLLHACGIHECLFNLNNANIGVQMEI